MKFFEKFVFFQSFIIKKKQKKSNRSRGEPRLDGKVRSVQVFWKGEGAAGKVKYI